MRARVCALAALLSVAACGRPVPDQASAPPAVAIVAPSEAFAGDDVTFDSSASDDGSVVSLRWDFGDGDSAEGARVTHVYAEAGGYVVALTAVDDDGETGKAEQVLTVSAPHPVASFAVSTASAAVGTAVTFDAGGSRGPAPLVHYAWTFGDGDSADGVVVSHAFLRTGTFHVGLTVTDDAGADDHTAVDVDVVPVDVSGTWTLSASPSPYACASYAAPFPESSLVLGADASGAVTATGASGRVYAGTVDGAALSLRGTVTLDAGSCGSAPVDVALDAVVDGDTLDGHATAYFDLAVGCQCSAGFTVHGTR